jgi:hypothetical protein
MGVCHLLQVSCAALCSAGHAYLLLLQQLLPASVALLCVAGLCCSSSCCRPRSPFCEWLGWAWLGCIQLGCDGAELLDGLCGAGLQRP